MMFPLLIQEEWPGGLSPFFNDSHNQRIPLLKLTGALGCGGVGGDTRLVVVTCGSF